MMKVALLLTAVLASASIARAQPGGGCAQELLKYLHIEQGVLDASKSSSRENVYKLDPEHSVYRVVPAGKPSNSYILKTYPSPADLNNDLRGLAILRNNPGFEVVAAGKGQTPNSMVLKDIRGRSLGSILSEPRLPSPVRARLVEDYSRRVRELESFLREHYQVESLRPAESAGRLPGFMARIVDPGTRESVKIWMRPDQVVIPEAASQTGSGVALRMVIVDPY